MSTEKVSACRCASLRPAREEDLPSVHELLRHAGLPTAGVAEWLPHFLVAEYEGEIVAVAGLEIYGPSGLLRSVAVRPEWRGTGLGRQLVDRLLSEAQARGTDDVYLLTTTAEHYFPRLGFACVTRDEVPERVQTSVEFTGACPSSAVVMQRKLTPETVPASQT
jgi:amino-acid N-acetyltransferase